MTSLDSHCIVNPQVLDQEVQGESVLLHLGSEAYFGLDPLGTLVWRQLREGMTLRDIHGHVHEIYDVDARRLERDLIQLMDDLQSAGLVSMLPPDADAPR